ncbi:MAG: nitrilase-related carbon-nitrogen hydrolase [Nocardioidaceae bacterium]
MTLAPVTGAVIASGVLWSLGTGLHPVPWLTWFALVPVLVVATRTGVRTAAAVAFAGYVMGLAGYAHYAVMSLEMPLGVVAALVVTLGGVVTGVVLLYRVLVLRGLLLVAVLTTAGAWAGAEFLVARFSPFGANWSLANSQAALLPVIQVASLTGIAGISFVVVAAGAGLATLATGRRAWTSVATTAVLVTVVLGYGVFRLANDGATAQQQVTLVATTSPGYIPDVSSPPGRALLKRDLDVVASLPDAAGQVVVFPEKDVTADDAALMHVKARFRRAAAANGVTVVLGLEWRSSAVTYNQALTFPADGARPVAYAKQHPIVGAEAGTTSGDRDGFVPHTGRRLGVAICADLAHPDLGRSYARAGTRLLLVPALDFDVDDWSQSRAQLLRGVESGFSMARASRQGFLTIADDRGRVLAETRTRAGATRSLTYDVPLGHGATFYARTGDWFGWLCVALAVIGVAISASRTPTAHRRRRTGGRSAVTIREEHGQAHAKAR